MPRYEKEGFDPKKRINNDERDRSVPIDENYYSGEYEDIYSNDFNGGSVYDNQNGVNPCNNYNGTGNYSSLIDSFESERPDDFSPNLPKQDNRTRSQNNNHSNKNSNNHSNKRNKNNGKNGRGRNSSHHLSVGKRIFIVFLALILIIVGSIFPVLSRIKYDDKVNNQYISASELQSSAMIKNILFLGVDARSSDEDEASRSDSMMLVSIDMKHKCIKMTSFLRDTWVYIPSEDKEAKLNAACAYGGYNGVVDTIEYNFGIKIDGYLVADFEMFKVLVDSIGGVEVDVTKKEAKEVTKHPKRYGNVTLESGKNNLTGEQALAYCRIRKIDSDFMRTKRQRTVLSAVITKMKKSNPFSLYKMAFNSAPYVETNMSKSQLISTVMRAGICVSGDMHQTKVPFEHTWEYATKSGQSVIAINTEKNKEQLIDFIYNKTSAELTSQEAEENK